MAEVLTEVRIVGLIPSKNSVAIFLGNETKMFSIHVDHIVGTNIALLLRGEKRKRPLTHDLINLIFQAFTIRVTKIIINDFKDETYFARLVLQAENEIQRKIVEIDARPSDCMAIAVETKTPLHVSAKVWDNVADSSDLFEEMKQNFEEGGMVDELGDFGQEEQGDEEDDTKERD
ncbi:MAG: bifunctional nuclease family protein [Blastochloris sp.]|jgi:bifunctional DNase/RNase|nr:bifunctional nuclease family protein [Blastochloris sp.]